MKKALCVLVFGMFAMMLASGCGLSSEDIVFGGGSSSGYPPPYSPPTYSISGKVSEGVEGVTISLAGIATTTTDWYGNYHFLYLSNGSYTVTPSLAGYTFDPPSRVVTIFNAEVTVEDFVATRPSYSISGTVSGAVSAGVPVYLTGRGTATTTTDGSGNYTFAGLTNGSYTITPSLYGYRFNPESIAATMNYANVTGNNFVASIYTGPYIYVADYGNNRIVRTDIGTNWTATRGSGTNQFNSPLGIFVDAAGKIYVADGNNRIVRMDDMSGTNWTTFGSSGSGLYQFMYLSDIFVDTAGKIYVADSSNNRIVRMDDMTGTNWTTFGTSGSGTNQFSFPHSVFVDTAGKIYVADYWNGRIVRVDDMSGTNWTTFGSGTNQFSSPEGIFVDAAGKIYVSDLGNHRIVWADDMSGAGWTTFGTYGSGTNQFCYPTGIFVR